MNTFAREHRHPGFVWLGKYGASWVVRADVPASLLEAHDAALASLDLDPNDRRAAVARLDACDAIRERVDQILDRPAVQARLETDMRKRALDTELRHRFSR